MTKPKPPVVAAPEAATTLEPPRQTAETAAEAGLPTVPLAPDESTTSEFTPEEQQNVRDALNDREEFARFLIVAFTDAEFSQLLSLVQVEAERRGLLPEVTAPAPVAPALIEAPAIDPQAAVRAAMQEEGITRAWLLPDGSWRFSEAFALKAVGDNSDSLTLIEA